MSAQILRDIADLKLKVDTLISMAGLPAEGFKLVRDRIEALESRVMALESPKSPESHAESSSSHRGAGAVSQ